MPLDIYLRNVLVAVKLQAVQLEILKCFIYMYLVLELQVVNKPFITEQLPYGTLYLKKLSFESIANFKRTLKSKLLRDFLN